MSQEELDNQRLFMLVERARSVVDDQYVRRLVDRGMLPYPVSEVVLENTKGDKKAKERRSMAARSLAVLKRDYPEIYEKLISENQDEVTSP